MLLQAGTLLHHINTSPYQLSLLFLIDKLVLCSVMMIAHVVAMLDPSRLSSHNHWFPMSGSCSSRDSCCTPHLHSGTAAMSGPVAEPSLTRRRSRGSFPGYFSMARFSLHRQTDGFIFQSTHIEWSLTPRLSSKQFTVRT